MTFREEIIGDARLILGDCREVLPGLGKVDMVMTSPPYDSLRDYEQTGRDQYHWIYAIPLLASAIKYGGVIIWNIADSVIDGCESGNSMRQALYFMEQPEIRLHDTMLYLKTNVNFPDTVRYENGFEYMYVFSRGKPKYMNFIIDRPNLWAGTSMHGTDRQKDGTLTPISGKGKPVGKLGKRFNWWFLTNSQPDNGHPAPMPYQMAADHITTWTDTELIVLDPFMGSGTTGVACAKLGRKFIGIEIEPTYFDIACRRIEQAYKQPDMFIERPAPAKQVTLL